MNLITTLQNSVARFAKDEEGAAAIEYAVIAGLIVALIIVAVTTIGTEVSAFFTAIAAALTA